MGSCVMAACQKPNGHLLLMDRGQLPDIFVYQWSIDSTIYVVNCNVWELCLCWIRKVSGWSMHCAGLAWSGRTMGTCSCGARLDQVCRLTGSEIGAQSFLFYEGWPRNSKTVSPNVTVSRLKPWKPQVGITRVERCSTSFGQSIFCEEMIESEQKPKIISRKS